MKHPEPTTPLIAGWFSGLPEDALVRLDVRNTRGDTVLWGTHRGNGLWEAVISSREEDYIVTVEVQGYVSQPISYTIHVRGEVAYIVRNEQVTDEEALHLDFHFVKE